MGRPGNREPAGTKWVFLGVRGSGDGVVLAGGVGQGQAARAGIRGFSLSNKSLSHRILNIPLK